MSVRLIWLLPLLALGSCGKKADYSPQNITLQMTSADTQLSLTDVSLATMGVGGCDSGLKKKAQGAPRQTLELPHGETGCYGYLASFTLDGHRFISDDMTPGTFRTGKSVHFFSKEAGRLMKVTTTEQLSPQDNHGRSVTFALQSARYLKFFPYNQLPVTEVTRIAGNTASKLPLRVDGFAYRGLSATGAPKFSLAISCVSAEYSKGHTQRCDKLDIAKLRFAVISRNAPQGSKTELDETWGQLEPSLMPVSPTAVIGRRLLFQAEAFTAEGHRARIAGSRQYVLVFAYEGGYELHRFPLPTVRYLWQPGGMLKRL